MHLLFSSDLHLGRTPARIPGSWREDLRTVRTWERLVDYACSEKMDALVLGGDVVDESNRFWEVLGSFQRGADRLHAAGIRLVAVAGNHDADVLPRLADRLGPDKFTLLGRGGKWESIPLPSAAQPECLICGWSFPSTHVYEDPLLQYRPPESHLPRLGLLHGDLGAGSSSYAPLSAGRMATLPLAGWLLGHIHIPRCQGTTPWILMPGSPQALDPGESGPHHAWRIQIQGGLVSPPAPCLPASLRYETLSLKLNRPEDAEDAALHEVLQRHVESLDSEYLLLRLRIAGSLPLTPAVQERLRNLRHLEMSPRIRMDAVEVHLSEGMTPESSGLSPALSHAWSKLSGAELPDGLSSALQDLQNETARHPVFAGLPASPSPAEALKRARGSLERHIALSCQKF